MSVTVRDIQAFRERGETIRHAHRIRRPFRPAPRRGRHPAHPGGGQPLGMVVLGHDSTLPVTVDQMIHHTAAVRRGVTQRVRDRRHAVHELPGVGGRGIAQRGPLPEGRRRACVKLEGGGRVLELVGRMIDAGIPVMGHIGLTPQSVNQFGGYRVQGRSDENAHLLIKDAKALEAAGAFAVVLEAVPAELATEVTDSVQIPTIGIGAGPDCSGQVLVFHDFLGITDGRQPQFVKRYAELGAEIKRAAAAFAHDVADGSYPGPEHSYE